jgi:hypothetical protein
VTLASTTEADLRIELWISFLGLLRSYAAAASQHGIEHHVLDIGECEAYVTATGKTLDIWCSPATGVGEWAIGRLESDPRGEFLLNLDGTISLNDTTVDMDHAVIDLISILTKPVNSSRQEFQVVIQFGANSIKDFDELISIEDILARALPVEAVVDGHDFGQGEFNIFVLTSSPRNAFEAIARELKTQHRLDAARAAYRKPGTEQFIILWPPKLQEFRVA